jgi:hypothetical protein
MNEYCFYFVKKKKETIKNLKKILYLQLASHDVRSIFLLVEWRCEIHSGADLPPGEPGYAFGLKPYYLCIAIRNLQKN